MLINVAYTIDFDTYEPFLDIQEHHPGLRAKFLVNRDIWRPPEHSQSKKSPINVVNTIDYDTYTPLTNLVFRPLNVFEMPRKGPLVGDFKF